MRPASSIAGRILRVNLSTGRVWTEETLPYVRNYIGGRGINARILFDEVKPGISAFDPANRLILGTGPLVGTLAPCACRHNVDAKSPMTEGIGSGNSCGHFSAELKYAGFDHVVIQGRARSPVYLRIEDGRCDLRDASHLWGGTTGETDDRIKEDEGDETVQVASIGPAGENLVRSACLIANRARAAARCGLGAVMGSKNLKAFVVRGSNGVGAAHPRSFMEQVKEAWNKTRTSPTVAPYREWGTFRTPEVFNTLGHLPVRNFQDEFLDQGVLEGVDPARCRREYEVRRLGYTSCPVSCSHFYRVEKGPLAGLVCEGIETNDVLNFVSKLEIKDLAGVIQLHHLCSEYGLDQDNVSGAVAWAFECYQRGILGEEETDGLRLQWGDQEVVGELLRKTAWREGIGDLLAEGSKRAADVIGKGSGAFAIHIKGQDSIEALRGSGRAWALGCVVSTRGGTHTRGANLVEMRDYPEEVYQRVWGVPKLNGPLAYEYKPHLVSYYEQLRAVNDSLGICNFVGNDVDPDLMGPDRLAGLFQAATGIRMTGEELMTVGRRIHNIEKAFNVLHAGYGRKDDYPPRRFVEEPVASGPRKGERLPIEAWDAMLDEYYELNGWDRETGLQTRECLESLGLQEIADRLEAAGRIGRSGQKGRS